MDIHIDEKNMCKRFLPMLLLLFFYNENELADFYQCCSSIHGCSMQLCQLTFFKNFFLLNYCFSYDLLEE